MALVSGGHRIRREIPHEPGEWMRFMPLTIDHAHRSDEVSNFEAGLQMLFASLKDWSYVYPATTTDEHGNEVPHPEAGQPVPCVEEHIRRLDIGTANWAMNVVQEISNLDAIEGEVSAAVSRPTTSGTAAGPTN